MFSKQLKVARKNKKLTQEELAILVNTTKATISNYENEYSEPSIEMLLKLSEKLGVSIDFLCGKVVSTTNKSSNVSYGERLKYLRNERDMTQEEISEQLNISRSTYARYETSDTQPDFETLIKLSSIFNVTIDYIVSGGSHSNEDFYKDSYRKDLEKQLVDLEKYYNSKKEELLFKLSMLK